SYPIRRSEASTSIRLEPTAGKFHCRKVPFMIHLMLQSGFCFTTTAGRAQRASCCDFCRVRDAAVRWSGSLLPPGAGGAPPHDGERMTATTDAVVVEGITKRYNSLTAVSDLSLRIRRG